MAVGRPAAYSDAMPLAYGLIHPVDLTLPDLPPALDRLRIAHVTDLHARAPRRRHHTIASQLAAVRFDLLVLTGDYMSYPGDEPAALDALRLILSRPRPRLGTFGVFGNHDTEDLAAAAADLPVHWLRNQAHAHPDAPLQLIGLDHKPDAVALAQHLAGNGGPADPKVGPDTYPARGPASSGFPLALVHHPHHVPIVAELGARVALSGHTHGGQIRTPWNQPLKNSSPLPLHLTSGLFRHGDTLASVARGVGESLINLRLFCPPQLPIYTLRRGPLPGQRTAITTPIRHW